MQKTRLVFTADTYLNTTKFAASILPIYGSAGKSAFKITWDEDNPLAHPMTVVTTVDPSKLPWFTRRTQNNYSSSALDPVLSIFSRVAAAAINRINPQADEARVVATPGSEKMKNLMEAARVLGTPHVYQIYPTFLWVGDRKGGVKPHFFSPSTKASSLGGQTGISRTMACILYKACVQLPRSDVFRVDYDALGAYENPCFLLPPNYTKLEISAAHGKSYHVKVTGYPTTSSIELDLSGEYRRYDNVTSHESLEALELIFSTIKTLYSPSQSRVLRKTISHWVAEHTEKKKKRTV